jgi:hypothetical protein
MKGIKAYGDKGCPATHELMKYLYNCIVFKSIAIEDLVTINKKRAMESLIFLTKKKNRKIKARTCTNISTQCEYTDQNKAASPKAMIESHLITAVIDAKQGRNVINTNIPKAFVQTDIEEKLNGEEIITKI